LTRQATIGPGLAARVSAETTVDAAEPRTSGYAAEHTAVDWHALQTRCARFRKSALLDFPDIDIDRYEIDGTNHEVMLAARELNVDKLPESSRNWINDN